MRKPTTIYAIPTLLTLGNLLCGFLAAALLASWESPLRLPVAAGLIPLAMLFDGIDGLVARRLGAVSRFGIELDSLADVVSFGVAPAMLLLQLQGPLRPITWAVSAWLLCAAALRLARFSSQTDAKGVPRHFEGLPCPAAASLVAGVAMAIHSARADLPSDSFRLVESWTLRSMPVLALGLGLLMVSNVRYPRPLARLAEGSFGFPAAATAALSLVGVIALGGYAIVAVCGLFVAWPLITIVVSLGAHSFRAVGE